MSTNVNTSSPTNTTSVPIRPLAKVPRRFMLMCSWESRVVLPLTDELNQEVDLRLGEPPCVVHDRARPGRLRAVGGIVRGDRSPVGHDAAVVLEPGEAV